MPVRAKCYVLSASRVWLHENWGESKKGKGGGGGGGGGGERPESLLACDTWHFPHTGTLTMLAFHYVKHLHVAPLGTRVG